MASRMCWLRMGCSLVEHNDGLQLPLGSGWASKWYGTLLGV